MGAVSPIHRVLDAELSTDSPSSVKELARSCDDGVGVPQLALVGVGDVVEAENVSTIAHDRWAVLAFLVEARDRERRARRGGEHAAEFAVGDASKELAIDLVVQQVAVFAAALYRVVVDQHWLEAQLGEEGGEPVGSRIWAREEDEHLTRGTCSSAWALGGLVICLSDSSWGRRREIGFDSFRELRIDVDGSWDWYDWTHSSFSISAPRHERLVE
jgi:hypothetical protein